MAELAAQNARFEEAKSQGKEVYNSSTDGRSGIDPYGATAIGYDIISGNWLAYAIADADPTWKQAMGRIFWDFFPRQLRISKGLLITDMEFLLLVELGIMMYCPGEMGGFPLRLI